MPVPPKPIGGVGVLDSRQTSVMIDLRSDTVTRPSPEMLATMMASPLGDDVWGDDPTVAELESATASLLGKEAGMFAPSGTQANLCALMAHCQRGDEYLVGETAHTYRYEAGGAAVLGSIQPQPVHYDSDGVMNLDHAASLIKPNDAHFANTRLLALENTKDGQVMPLSHHQTAAKLAQTHGLGLHLDGARLWNAAVALEVAPSKVAEHFDTVSVCLSKGLGAPVGSVLVGQPALIEQARRWRKMLGGGMRQAGLLAGAGLYAIDNNIDRMKHDHANAAKLANGLAPIEGIEVLAQNTNMVFAEFATHHGAEQVQQVADAADVRIAINGRSARMVTHLDVSSDDIDTVVELVKSGLK